MNLHVTLWEGLNRVIGESRLHDVIETRVANTDGQLKRRKQEHFKIISTNGTQKFSSYFRPTLALIKIGGVSNQIRIDYQELGGAEHVQGERLDPGVVDPQLPVDPRALDTRQDAQVGREPCGLCGRERERERHTHK